MHLSDQDGWPACINFLHIRGLRQAYRDSKDHWEKRGSDILPLPPAQKFREKIGSKKIEAGDQGLEQKLKYVSDHIC